MEETKRPRGRPRTEAGETPTRSVRIGAIWVEAMAVASERHEPLNQVITRALESYVRRHRRSGTTPSADLKTNG